MDAGRWIGYAAPMFSARPKVLITALFLSTALAACGVKGSPLPPETQHERETREAAEAEKAAKTERNKGSGTAPAKK